LRIFNSGLDCKVTNQEILLQEKHMFLFLENNLLLLAGKPGILKK